MARKIRELSELPKEKVELLTGHRFKIVGGNEQLVVDTEREKEITVGSFDGIEARVRELAKDLVLIANHRVKRYDALLNSVESWTTVVLFMKQTFPGLLTSGVLQPLVDLDGCLHDLVVGRISGLIASRDALFDGGYRWIESYDVAYSEGEEPREPTKRTVRTYQDIIEGRITLVWLALKYGLPKGKVAEAMERLMKDAEIRNCDDQLDTPITADNVKTWFASVSERGRALGRRYCYEADVRNFGDRLKACKGNSEEALTFAREQLEWVRCRQPINRPIPHSAKEESIKSERTGPRKTARGK